jgi:hypothetical protein
MPSTNSWVLVTGFESVVPALTVTGDVTVALLSGVQIVTEGDAVFRVHGGVLVAARKKFVSAAYPLFTTEFVEPVTHPLPLAVTP